MSFTSKELREMSNLPNLGLESNINMIREIASSSDIKLERSRKRILDILIKTPDSSKCTKRWILDFYLTPSELLFDESKCLKGIICRKNMLIGGHESGVVQATNENVSLECGRLFKCIGYQSTPLEDIPFDKAKCIVPNLLGMNLIYVFLALSKHL
jgi:ferredoxin/flavodoxin---NADP+ reductase